MSTAFCLERHAADRSVRPSSRRDVTFQTQHARHRYLRGGGDSSARTDCKADGPAILLGARDALVQNERAATAAFESGRTTAVAHYVDGAREVCATANMTRHHVLPAKAAYHSPMR
jgi:hypothetical protein